MEARVSYSSGISAEHLALATGLTYDVEAVIPALASADTASPAKVALPVWIGNQTSLPQKFAMPGSPSNAKAGDRSSCLTHSTM